MDKAQFTEPLNILNVTGLNPFRTDITSKLLKLSTVAIYVTVIGLILVEVIADYRQQGVLTDALVILSPAYAVFWKSVILLFRSEKLKILIKYSAFFWNLDAFGQKYTKLAHSYHKLARKLFKMYFVMCLAATFQYFISCVLKGEPLVPYYGQNKDFVTNNGLNWIAFVLHAIHYTIIISISVAFDGLFLYFISHSLAEFKMVEIAFNSKAKKLKCLKNVLEHHSNVLVFVNKLNEAYSVLFFHQHLSSLLAICFGCVMLTSNGMPPSSAVLSKFVPYVLGFVVQIFVYCYAGQLLIEASIRVANGIFVGSFHATGRIAENSDLRMMALKRAQKRAGLQIGGFGDLDLASFNEVLKNAMSFITFINAVLNK